MKIHQTNVNHPQTEPHRATGNPGNLRFSRLLHKEISEQPGTLEQGSPMILGTITRETPTISQLLFKSPLKDECWNIIYNPVNGKKSFHRIRPGTRILYDPVSKELLWGKRFKEFMAAREPKTQELARNSGSGKGLPDFLQENGAAGLSKAVKEFIGQDYEKMDCFELVVGGLREMGVKYRGKGGLGHHLINQALERGLPRNHFLNGEGLVSESGTSVFKKTIFSVKNPKIQAQSLMKEIQNLLEEGQILSFSMRNKGHTGVVSRSRDCWTFVNSGDMDHNLSGDNGSKKVGEEDLKSEMENWFILARDMGQGLKISLGTLDIDRLSMFRPNRFSQKV